MGTQDTQSASPSTAEEHPLQPEFALALARAERSAQLRLHLREEFILERARLLADEIAQRARPFCLREERTALDEHTDSLTRLVTSFEIETSRFNLYRQGRTLLELATDPSLQNVEPFRPTINWQRYASIIRPAILVVPRVFADEEFTLERADPLTQQAGLLRLQEIRNLSVYLPPPARPPPREDLIGDRSAPDQLVPIQEEEHHYLYDEPPSP